MQQSSDSRILACYVPLGKLLILSELHFAHLKIGDSKNRLTGGSVSNKYDNIHIAFR